MNILEIAAQLPLEAALAVVALIALIILGVLVQRGVIPRETIEKLAALPLVAPILAFLRSERFIAGLAAATAIGLVMQFPPLAPFQEELSAAIAVLYGVFFVGHSYEKAKGGELGGEDPAAPVLGPLGELLRSRKFLAVLVGMLIDVAIALNPDWAPYQAQLIALVTAFFSAMVGAIALEDGAAKGAGLPAAGMLEELAPFPDEPASGGMMRELAGASDRDQGTAVTLQQDRTLAGPVGGPAGRQTGPYLAGGPLSGTPSDPDWLRKPRGNVTEGMQGSAGPVRIPTIQGAEEARYVDLDPAGDLPEISRPPAGK